MFNSPIKTLLSFTTDYSIPTLFMNELVTHSDHLLCRRKSETTVGRFYMELGVETAVPNKRNLVCVLGSTLIPEVCNNSI